MGLPCPGLPPPPSRTHAAYDDTVLQAQRLPQHPELLCDLVGQLPAGRKGRWGWGCSALPPTPPASFSLPAPSIFCTEADAKHRSLLWAQPRMLNGHSSFTPNLSLLPCPLPRPVSHPSQGPSHQHPLLPDWPVSRPWPGPRPQSHFSPPPGAGGHVLTGCKSQSPAPFLTCRQVLGCDRSQLPPEPAPC
jgi:hypothetical protein